MTLAGRGDLPRHVAIIMDGNGRWAKKRRLPRVKGHEAGIRSVEKTVEFCAETGIEVLTLYAFSSENWLRPALEVNALMQLLKRFLRREVPRLQRNRIRLQAIGDLARLDDSVRAELRQAMAATADCPGMVLNLALSYGSRGEIVRAVRRLWQAADRGEVAPETLEPETFARYLDTAGLPDPDIILRTGGESRLSNFLLWQAAYAELYFTATLWPDFTAAELQEIFTDFQHRERRFGMISEQLQS
ncbi:MAG: isoprenyl transferase [Deltaproteobacteria bacterium]|nr:isoprenyl transferase [Deltaproteobacteria bacterium]